MFWNIGFVLILFFPDLSYQIQNLSPSNSNSSSNRQNFYHMPRPPINQFPQQQFQQQFQFQVRPDIGGPWQFNSNRPNLNPNFNPNPNPNSNQNVGIGSATPVVNFPGPVKVPTSTEMMSSQDIYLQQQTNNNRDKAPNTKPKPTSTPSGVKGANCSCGMVAKSARSLERITGGNLSKENAWPWMAAIVYIGSDAPFWFCGASLINDRYLITAAHCQRTIRRRGLSNIRILMGTNGIPAKATAADFYEISEMKMHPLYRQNIEEYDIGLIRLKKKVTFSEKISPICLTQRGSPYIGKMATVAGWGSIKYGDNPPENLREVEIKVVTNAVCQREYMYNYGTRITGPMLCAWLPGKDSCQGDSGGPLFLKDTNTLYYTQIGVVSFGPPQCGETTIPGVYTRVASTIRWIKSNTRDSSFCQNSF